MTKVKAHMLEKGLDGLTPHEVLLAKGNVLADAHALAASALHPHLTEGDKAYWSKLIKQAA